jgi:two-component system, NarL family, nitrate/nitrite response regulator NarL
MSGEEAEDRKEVVTVFISKNPLLSRGFKALLADTRFAVSDTGLEETSPPRPRLYKQPDLIIVDASDSSEELIETIKRLKVQQPEARVVVLANHYAVGFVRNGIDAGVDGFCLATSDREVLIMSLELVMRGESILPIRLVRSMLSEITSDAKPDQDSPIAEPLPSDPGIHKLSPREAEILGWLRRGEPNKVIAKKLDVTEATIKVHVKAILRKIGAANRTQAALWATEHLATRGGKP